MEEPNNTLAGAADNGMPGRRYEDDGVQKVHPFVMLDKISIPFADRPEDELKDFTPKPDIEVDGLEDITVEDVVVDPKDSSAPGSALAALYEQLRTPDQLSQGLESSDEQESPVPPIVEKANSPASTPPAVTLPVLGSQTSSASSSSGSEAPPA